MSCVVKRSFDADLPSPFHSKRCRPMGVAPDPAVVAPLSPANFSFPPESFRSTLESPFAFKQPSPITPAFSGAAAAAAAAAESPAEDGENSPFFVRRKRELFPQAQAQAHSQGHPQAAHRPVVVCGDCGTVTEKSVDDAISLEEARFRVDKAVRDMEMKLMREYDALLQTKLQEQFYIFSKFNQDHIHRQAPAQSYSYMS